ncbi:MAG: hypothetical protein ACRDPA_15820, partial [Solirubrobacteraceae bacterium]
MAAIGFRTMRVPRVYAVAGPAYGATVLALYAHVGVGERALGVLTWLVLLCALWPLPALARAQALGVIAFATVGEVAGSIVWGIYHYRSHDLPLFVPPGHGLVYLTGLAVARIVCERRIVWAAAVGSVGWGLAGLTLLPRLYVAGGLGVAVLGAFLWRSRARHVRRRLLRCRRPGAVRHLDRGLALDEDAAGPRHRRRQPAQRRGERLRGVRCDGEARRATARLRGRKAQAEASDPARTRG